MATTNSEFLQPDPANPPLYTGWTTVDSRQTADTLAAAIIEKRLAVCTQVEGPITSRYRWEDKLESAEEYRITIKFLESHKHPLSIWLHTHHPYQTPQWLVVKIDEASPAYLEWARSQ